jgi:hypothetical protein
MSDENESEKKPEHLKYGRGTPEEQARAKERELLSSFDRSMEATMRVLGYNPRAREPAPERGRGPEMTGMGHARAKQPEPVNLKKPRPPKAPEKVPEKVPEKELTLDEKARKIVVEREGLPRVRYDSSERRAAIQLHLERLGVNSELRAIREMLELGQGRPSSEAPKEAPEKSLEFRKRQQDPRERGIAREPGE